MEKRSIGSRVYEISEGYNIEQTKVKEIIQEFIVYCVRRLSFGERVDFLGLVSFIPDIELCSATTLAFKCYDLADNLGLPRYTVFCVVQEYISSLRDELVKGNTIEIRGMVSMHPMLESGVVTKVHSRISTSIKANLLNYNTNVTSVRVHTHKLLKRRLSAGA